MSPPRPSLLECQFLNPTSELALTAPLYTTNPLHTPPQPFENECMLSVGLSPADFSLLPSLTTPAFQPALPVDPVARFRELLRVCTTLINTNGPYRCTKNKHFKRAKLPPSKPLRSRQVQHSLACAQDALPYPQLPGPANNDLQIFASLWNTTLQLLTHILANNTLSLYSRGHGVYGLSADYNHPYLTPGSIAEFGARRAKLHQALLQLPSLEAEHVRQERDRIVLLRAERVEGLARTNREVHNNATLMVHTMRGDRWGMGGWEGLRWFHGVVVVEAWLRNLGME